MVTLRISSIGRSSLRQVTALALTAVFAAFITLVTLVSSTLLRDERTSLDYYLEGTVPRPFAYRVLIPGVLHILDAAMPSSLERLLARSPELLTRLEHWKLWPHLVTHLVSTAPIASGPEQSYAATIPLLGIVMFGCLVGYAVVGMSLCESLFARGPYRYFFAPLLLLLLVPIVERLIAHIYDYSALFLMMSMLWAMAKERQGIFLLLFALGCLNKETAVLASCAYAAVFYDRLSFPKYATMLVSQGLIFGAVYLGVRWRFAQNGGGDIEVWFMDNIHWFVAHAPAALLLFGAVGFLILARWSDQPLVLRRSSVMLLPHLTLYMAGAKPGEFRNFYESLPLISLFICRDLQWVGQWWAQRQHAPAIGDG